MGIIAWFSHLWAQKPRDYNHPYGHGKIELVSAGMEGGMIVFAGFAVIYMSVFRLIRQEFILEHLDWGVGLTLLSTAVNAFMARLLIIRGRQTHAKAIEADGKHLMSDAISSLGVIVGLLLVWITKWLWIDAATGALFGVILVFTGFKLLKEAFSGLLDEVDEQLLMSISQAFEEKREAVWIDVHNLRVLRYGAKLHIDAHLTMPFYFTLEQIHEEIKTLEFKITEHMQRDIEFFIHTDPCLPTSCSICMIKSCKERKNEFKKNLVWTSALLKRNKKHMQIN